VEPVVEWLACLGRCASLKKAGPTESGLYRGAVAAGIDFHVIAATGIPRRLGDRSSGRAVSPSSSDRRDAYLSLRSSPPLTAAAVSSVTLEVARHLARHASGSGSI
jgi:hypothetical protein